MNHPESTNRPTRTSFDAMPVRETSIGQINLDSVTEHLALAKAWERYTGTDDPLEYLLDRRCVIQIGNTHYLTLTGLLCFGRKPQSFFPNAVVNLGHYQGREAGNPATTVLEKNLGGTVFAQLSSIEKYLWKHIQHKMSQNESKFAQVEIHEYPQAVVRELSVNMLAHRDYTRHTSAAWVQLFIDRIEWRNPGNLMPDVTLKNMLTEQQCRNPNLMRVLRDAGYTEEIDHGLNTVIADLRKVKMDRPIFNAGETTFEVVVYGHSYQGQIQEDNSTKLTTNQQMIYQFIKRKGRVSTRDICNVLVERAERSIQRDLRVLIDKGKIMTVGETRALRYQLADG
jgi:ATP-dependent DNA helicase RecG